MASDWYEFANQYHFWMRWRHRIITYLIQNHCQQVTKCLDVGCGTGAVAQQLETQFHFTVDGCDLNPNVLSRTKLARGKLFFYDVTSKTLASKAKYDLITLLDVIEHIEDQTDFLKSLGDHLNKDGFLVINVPAFQFLYSRYDEELGHIRRYTLSNLSQTLADSGFCLTNHCYWGFSLIPLAIMRKFLMPLIPRSAIPKVGFYPPRPWINSLLTLLGTTEFLLPQNKWLGTSLACIAKPIFK